MPRRSAAYLLAALALVAAVAVAVEIDVAPEQDGGRCDQVAEPGDSPQELVDSLGSGETGCLKEGTYSAENQIRITTPGITLTSYPGERATLVGRLWIAQGADGVTVQNLDLDGRNDNDAPSPTVDASETVFRGNDITNGHSAICFAIGDNAEPRPSGIVIEENLIHDCGELPATNHHHGIYVVDASGTVIRNNWIHDNADRGIQLYPNADGTTITGNVIDGNGEGIIFSGEGGDTSSDNVVEHNVIANSRIRHNVESHWKGGASGEGNVVRENCVFGGARDDGGGGIETPPEGFALERNVVADPEYVDRAAGDFRLRPGSPCADLRGGAG